MRLVSLFGTRGPKHKPMRLKVDYVCIWILLIRRPYSDNARAFVWTPILSAMQFFRLTMLVAVAASAAAQSAPVSTTPSVWQMQDSGSTASLRGIDSVDGTIAWASGTGGTVLKTTDGGAHWQQCTIPDGDKDGATLDFRGVQAWDAQTAIVMASGPGDKSRLYKTTDGCKTWALLLKNPDKDGFWDAILLNRFDKDGQLLGDPVDGQFTYWETDDKGNTWKRIRVKGLAAQRQEGAFAASNSALFVDERYGIMFVTGGPAGPRILFSEDASENGKFSPTSLPLSSRSPGAGGFSVEARDWCCRVVVGGDYGKPDESASTAAWSSDGGKTWLASTTPPHGYRSTVQWSESQKLWITAGPNGSDLSRDDGKTWQPLDSGNWNALSLPFIVGPKGSIARLNPAALPKP
jgi:photosystem II stability/assembly factor-like uncharacterized protein